MTLFFEALVATVAAFLLFVCLTALGEKLYRECKKAECAQEMAEEESKAEKSAETEGEPAETQKGANEPPEEEK